METLTKDIRNSKLFGAAWLTLACSLFFGTTPEVLLAQTNSAVNSQLRPKPNFKIVAKGARLYGKNCAVCHGPLGQGHPHWNRLDASGKYPPPPLNGTGHTWHHPQSVLKKIIKEGTGKLGGNMPAWNDKLSDNDIDAILEWIKSQWPDEIYKAWAERNRQQ